MSSLVSMCSLTSSGVWNCWEVWGKHPASLAKQWSRACLCGASTGQQSWHRRSAQKELPVIDANFANFKFNGKWLTRLQFGQAFCFLRRFGASRTNAMVSSELIVKEAPSLWILWPMTPHSTSPTFSNSRMHCFRLMTLEWAVRFSQKKPFAACWLPLLPFYLESRYLIQASHRFDMIWWSTRSFQDHPGICGEVYSKPSPLQVLHHLRMQ